MLEYLQRLDEKLFLFLNGHHNGFFDVLMYFASDQYVWVPFYVFLAVYLFTRFRKIAFFYCFFMVLLVITTDQLSAGVIKDLVQRPRPSHVPALEHLIHLSPAGPGGLYGFTSNHAANTFGLAFFFVFTLPPGYKYLKLSLLSWAALVSYSRIYNGVHYPGDVLGGILVGLLSALLMAKLLRRVTADYLIYIGRLVDKRQMDEDE